MSIISLFKPVKKKSSPRSLLIRKLDALQSKKVREIAGHRCQRCGKTSQVYHHHLFTKTRLSTRWNVANACVLCFFCHRWAHSAGEEFRHWVLTWMPEKEYDALYLKSQMRGGYKDADLIWLYNYMKNDMKKGAA
jgi:hypothetical protein